LFYILMCSKIHVVFLPCLVHLKKAIINCQKKGEGKMLRVNKQRRFCSSHSVFLYRNVI
jgi:hypothetical protein